jgi:hypothetical protein
MAKKAWSFLAVVIAVAIAEGAGWVGTRLGVTGQFSRDLVIMATFVVVSAISRRLFGLPGPHTPYSEPNPQLGK